ncbi:MAG TPA: lysylphosphatidylglycerol synthase transmembrane domain-containing protein [Gemmatimonadales bacterium]
MTPRSRSSTRTVLVVLGFAISAVLIYFSFRGKDFHTLWLTIKTIHLLPMAGAIVLATLAFPLRVPRWQLLLPDADGNPLPAKSLWHAIAIGFAANNILLARAGEVLRVAAINRITGVSFGAGVASVAVERVIDALTVITLLGIGLVTAHLDPHATLGGKVPIETLARDTGLLCLLALALAIVASWRRDMALRLFERLLPSGPLATKVVGFVDNVLRGLGALRDWRRALPVVLWSFVVWTTSAAGYYLAFKAFDFPVPFAGALVIQGALMFGIAAPSTPGYAGIFEAVSIGSLALFGIGDSDALAYALTFHITTFFPITILGLISAVRTGVRLRPPADTP